MQHKSRTVRLSVGGSSILVIFVILTLTTFATLSLVSAQADLNLSKKAMSAAQEYYVADSLAEEIFADISKSLVGIGTGSFAVQAADALSHLDVEAVITGDEILISYIVEINEIQELHVQLLGAPGQITRQGWKVVTDPGEEEEDNLSVWGADDDFTLFDEGFTLFGGEMLDEEDIE